MRTVVPLKYGTVCKKAFSDPEVFTGFVNAVLGEHLLFRRVDGAHPALPAAPPPSCAPPATSPSAPNPGVAVSARRPRPASSSCAARPAA